MTEVTPQASTLNGLMDHWEERSKQPGVAGIAKYMAAFIRFLTINILQFWK